MIRCLLLCLLLCLHLLFPGLTVADDSLAALEQVIDQRNNLQPGLDNYSVRLVYDKVPEPLQGSSAKIPAQGEPALTKYWQRGTAGLVISSNGQTVSSPGEPANPLLPEALSNGLESILLPANRTEQRNKIAGLGKLKISDTIFGQTVLKRIELDFNPPASLQEAFFSRDLPLPQQQVSKLYFDIDDGTHTLQELGVLTSAGLKLTLEMRYHQVPGGFLPERIKITSPDGQIDDLFEISYQEIEGFSLPARFIRKLQAPDRQNSLIVTFEDYQINHPFPDEIRARMEPRQ